MTATNRWGAAGRPRALAVTVVAAVLALVTVGLVSTPAQAVAARVNLRVLVVSNGDPATEAIATELGREGIPFTQVNVGATGRPTIDAAFLEDAASGTARYQAVVLPNQAGGGPSSPMLSAAEIAALNAYEAAYHVRQVNGFDFPGPSMGAVFSGVSGTLDGSPATVTAAGLAGPFSYLKGPFTIEDVDPAVSETFGYLTNADPAIAAGQTFTPLVNATFGGSTGSILGVYAHDNREELVVTAAFNQYMQWFNTLAEGIVSWATRGIHLGYDRNYFTLHVDDVFLPDSRWSSSGDCTPGDNCVDTSVTTQDIRMTPDDVTKLVNWQNTNNAKLDMVFNGGGSELWKTDHGGTDPLADAFLANKAAFPWISHTYTHPFLGCIQIAPTVTGGTWHCATSTTETPKMDEDIPGALGPDGVYYATGAYVTQQLQDNVTWATTNALPGFTATELVTGEHSGLKTLPQQPNDNPFLANSLATVGVKWTASDASRETDSRAVGASTSTVPRHPMNIFYNAGTYQDEVDEYNWIYTSASAGGGGICEANPATSTCIAPLPAGDNTQARNSFDSYIKPLEIRNALRYVLANDPRPFYVHQSNLAEDGIVYPVLDGILSTYSTSYDTARTPLIHTTMAEAGQALSRMSAWTAASKASGYQDGYVDAAGVHLPAASVQVPLTVPAGSTGGTGLQAYGGALSGWLGGSSTVVPPTTAGGYVLASVPGAPTGVTAVAGSSVITVSWTAPASDGGSPITGYVLRTYRNGAAAPSTTTATGSTATSYTFTNLPNNDSYQFDVAAVNVAGTGPASSPLSTAVVPKPALAPVPTGVTGEAGNAAATVRWTPPANATGVSGYRVRVWNGTTVAKNMTVGTTATVAAVTGLANGTAYTFTVNVQTGGTANTANGPDSARSGSVTPSLTSQTATAPSISGVTAAPGSVTVTWSPPSDLADTTPTGYRVRVFTAGTTTQVKSTTTAATARTATLTGLTNGAAYEVEVNVQTANGNGPASARSASVTPTATAPAAPVIGSASSGTAGAPVTATARWSAPSSNGGSAITGYVVTATPAAGGTSGGSVQSSPVLAASARSYVMTLPAGGYTFTVVAINAVGSSQPSAASSQVTAA